MATILLADDEAKMRKILSLTLAEEGHEILEAGDGEKAVEIIRSTSLSLVITDLRMPGGGGMAVLETVHKINHYLPVIILTAYGTIENAVDALKRGAHDYLLKPCDLEELKLTVRKALQMRHLEQENLYLKSELSEQFGGQEIIGNSPAIAHANAIIRKVAQGDETVLIRGESGTGKELAARMIHKHSPRADKPFVGVKCSAQPADLLELELFGRVIQSSGAASKPATGKFELAQDGTIFLDEIGDLPPRLQGRILRTIEEGSIEPVGGTRSKAIQARLLASTNMDLEEQVRNEKFRADLYFRLNVIPLVMPPLRERKEDIPLLIQAFLKKKKGTRPTIQFPSDEIEKLMRYHWPGNVRELENIVERAAVLETTDAHQLIPAPQPPMTPAAQMSLPASALKTLEYKDAKKTVLDEFERNYFSAILRQTKGNVSRAAEIANIHRKNLHVKLSELNIDAHEFSHPGGDDST